MIWMFGMNQIGCISFRKYEKINYDDVISKASVIYKNKIEEKYREKHPDLDMNLVELELTEGSEAILEAMINAINETN